MGLSGGGTGAAPARIPLSRARALEIIQAMPMLVAFSASKIEPGAIVNQCFEVEEDRQKFAFDEQPFRIVREISRAEYLAALPKHHRRVTNMGACHYYEIFTD